MDVIYGASVKGNGEDKLCYRPNKKNGFIVSDYYWVLLCISDQSFRWKLKIPSRVAFFVCIDVLEKILTIDNLWREIFYN